MSRYVNAELDRDQVSFLPMSFDDMISEDNPVRVIEALADSYDMVKMNFTHAITSDTGRKPYDPRDILKLYLYGYFNGIRSSRKLAKECQRNIEVMWLLKGIKPDFRTIADFRKENIKNIKHIFKDFSFLCNELNLIGKEIVAIDGSKFRANNAKKKNHSKGKISKKIKYFEEVAEKYLKLLEENDKLEADDQSILLSKQDIQAKIKHAKERMDELNRLYEEVLNHGEISTTDPDSRQMGTANNGNDICHNVQIAVDEKHHLVVAVDVTSSPADQGQLYKMAAQAKEELNVDEITVLADKAYGIGEDLRKCEENGIAAIVSIQEHGTHTGNSDYVKEKFKYNPEQNTYTCPRGQILYPKAGGIYNNPRACRACEYRNDCTKNKNGRSITRGEYQQEFDRAKKRVEENMELYKKRQLIVEHPFGTVKRGLGYTYFLLRRNEKVKSESLMHFLIYNIKRVINIIGITPLVDAIKYRKAKIAAV